MLVAVHQPNYLPWPGFFHKWLLADALVLLDTVQFVKNEWQNRNRIKTAQGVQWLTVPVHYRFPMRLDEVAIAGGPWARKHIATIEQAYAQAPFFADCWLPLKEQVQKPWRLLRDLNVGLIRALGAMLGCTAPLHLASDMHASDTDATDRLVSLCLELGADAYLSGQEGRNYLQADQFAAAGLALCYQQVEAPVYAQLHGEFISHLSVADLLFNVGPGNSREIIRNMGGLSS